MNERVERNDNDAELSKRPQLDRKCPQLGPDEDRYGIDPRTGFEYVKRRPGERMVTSEEILKDLEDFP